MSLVLAVLLADAAHEGSWLASLLQADELDGVHLVLQAQRALVGLVLQRHASVLGQRARRVCEQGALGTQVCGAHRAVHGRRVALILIATDDALTQKRRSSSSVVVASQIVFPYNARAKILPPLPYYLACGNIPNRQQNK